ncbi:hypothetical protein HDU83_001304 [Entophlyctis luteolus]|nr:hypothetical protein HDU83_001304 [Entophlyctis luteolus]
MPPKTEHRHRDALDKAVGYIQEIYANDKCWTTVKTERNIKIKVKDQPAGWEGSGLLEMPSLLPAFRGDGVIKKITVQEVASVLRGFAARKLWDPRFEQGKQLESLNSFENLVLSSQKGNIVVRSRDFLTANTYRLDNTGDSALIVSTSVTDVLSPPDNGYFSSYVRGEAKAIGWLLSQQGTDVLVTYIVEVDVKGQIPQSLISIIQVQAPLCIANVSSAIDSSGTLPFAIDGLSQYGPSRRITLSNEWIDPTDLQFKIKAVIPPGKSNFSVAFPCKGKYGSGAAVEVTKFPGLEVLPQQMLVSKSGDTFDGILSSEHTYCVLKFQFSSTLKSACDVWLVAKPWNAVRERRFSTSSPIISSILGKEPIFEVNGEKIVAEAGSPVDSAVEMLSAGSAKDKSSAVAVTLSKSFQQAKDSHQLLNFAQNMAGTAYQTIRDTVATLIATSYVNLTNFLYKQPEQTSSKVVAGKSHYDQLDDMRILNFILEQCLIGQNK